MWGGWLMMWCLRGKTRSTKRHQWSPRNGLGETRMSDAATQRGSAEKTQHPGQRQSAKVRKRNDTLKTEVDAAVQ